ncbi:MAG: DUF2784 domain-containing protein [Aquabacterium sp.]
MAVDPPPRVAIPASGRHRRGGRTQAWLGQYCFLTHWESSLRIKAGQTGYEVSFIEHWVQRVLYFDAPLWVFACLYSVFGALVAWAWWRYPPR